MNDYEKIQSAFGEAIAQQQGHFKNSDQEQMKTGIEPPSIVELLTEIRDDIRLMRQAMDIKKQYETKVNKPALRYKGMPEPEETESVETKNG